MGNLQTFLNYCTRQIIIYSILHLIQAIKELSPGYQRLSNINVLWIRRTWDPKHSANTVKWCYHSICFLRILKLSKGCSMIIIPDIFSSDIARFCQSQPSAAKLNLSDIFSWILVTYFSVRVIGVDTVSIHGCHSADSFSDLFTP